MPQECKKKNVSRFDNNNIWEKEINTLSGHQGSQVLQDYISISVDKVSLQIETKDARRNKIAFTSNSTLPLKFER